MATSLQRSKSALDEPSSARPIVGSGNKRKGRMGGRMAALKEQMSEKVNSPSSTDRERAESITEEPFILPDVAPAAKKELQDAVLQLLLTPLVPPDLHVQLSKDSSGTERNSATAVDKAAMTVLKGRVDSLENQSIELREMAESFEQESMATEQQAEAAAAQTALFVSQAEAFTQQLQKMGEVIEKLEKENQALRLSRGGESAPVSPGGMPSPGGDPNDIEELRKRNKQLETEIKSIKSNNVRSMQKLMKELNSKDSLLKAHGITS